MEVISIILIITVILKKSLNLLAGYDITGSRLRRLRLYVNA